MHSCLCVWVYVCKWEKTLEVLLCKQQHNSCKVNQFDELKLKQLWEKGGMIRQQGFVKISDRPQLLFLALKFGIPRPYLLT